MIEISKDAKNINGQQSLRPCFANWEKDQAASKVNRSGVSMQ